MTCERCIHYDICNEHADGLLLELAQGVCFRFKDKHSWAEVKPGLWTGFSYHTCSVCGKEAPDDGWWKSAFCPHCGAMMDGERKDNDK